jgi:outer membrane protein assembly factor BamE (lipoprotein component of BamABCDE complex)
MTLKLIAHTPRALLAAGLFLGVAAAQAASGYTVTPKQEALVAPGMSTDEVRQALGTPERDATYGNEPGPTWTYEVVGASGVVFDVDFGSDGKVTSVSERVVQDGD